MISEPNSLKEEILAIKLDRKRETIVAPTIDKKARRKSWKSPSQAEKAKPLKGNIRGATNMAPIMTAVLLLNSPKEAIKQEITLQRIKSVFQEESIISS
jgi:hypothetical protein